MSATPRTDAAEIDMSGHGVTVHTRYVRADFARELERELAAERALADRLAGELRWRVEAGGYGAEQGKQSLAAWEGARNDP